MKEAIEKFLLYLEAKGDSPRTIATYRQRLKWFAAAMPALTDINQDDIDNWVVRLRRRDLAPASVNSRIRDARNFLKWCVERGHIPNNPASHLKVKRFDPRPAEKAMTTTDLKRLLRAVDYERDRAIIMFLASTGCRSGEAATLKLKNLNLIKREAWVEGKTGGRWVDYNQATADALNAWLAIHPNPDSDAVFVGLTAPYAPIRESTIYQMMRRTALRAGVTGKWNPHSVRHLVGQIWADNANLELVRQKLGHRDIQSTLVYANQDRGRVKRLTDKLDII